MFARGDGPTALRADLIRALSFSLQDTEVDLGGGPESARAALAAVWNGRKGQVIILVRFVGREAVDRYAYSEPLPSEEDVAQAVELALGFTDSLGLLMDGPEFQDLELHEQDARLRIWDELRTVAAPARPARARPVPSGPEQPQPSGPAREPQRSAPAPPTAPPAPSKPVERPSPRPRAQPAPQAKPPPSPEQRREAAQANLARETARAADTGRKEPSAPARSAEPSQRGAATGREAPPAKAPAKQPSSRKARGAGSTQARQPQARQPRRKPADPRERTGTQTGTNAGTLTGTLTGSRTGTQPGRKVLGKVSVVRKRRDPSSPEEGIGRVLVMF
jgi:hypothetical protein